MKNKLLAAILFLNSYAVLAQSPIEDTVFITRPYLQIGSNPDAHSIELLWHAGKEATWKAEYKINNSADWKKAEVSTVGKITLPASTPYLVYRANFTGLTPGSIFTYRVRKNNKEVFQAKAHAPKSPEQTIRFVATGDMGAGTKEAREIAGAIFQADPDFVAIAGDVVYERGLVSEYKTRFWPIYNADKVDTSGVPLMRRVPFIAAVGNHDADTRDLDLFPDALAYYLFWDQPLNGPVGREGGAVVPVLKGSEEKRKAFLDGAGKRYPRMTNFSFNYSNTHWTVLDADTYVDWTDKELTEWVVKDLEDSKDVTWHFVLFHHPGFNSSKAHFEQQQMRILAPVFEAGHVDIVFTGHVHNYQRTYPMAFAPDKEGIRATGMKDNKQVSGRFVEGKWTLDKTFDGTSNTKPQGVIYLVTGAGGQHLYNPEQTADPGSWQPFTDKFISTVHTFTVVDVSATTLKLRQLTAAGKELDAITVTKE